MESHGYHTARIELTVTQRPSIGSSLHWLLLVEVTLISVIYNKQLLLRWNTIFRSEVLASSFGQSVLLEASIPMAHVVAVHARHIVTSSLSLDPKLALD